MKCPKCGYVSFDHNQVCPKCKKDISTEQKKLNLPDYQPSPPSLLGAVTGETVIQTSAVMFDEGQNLDIDLSSDKAGGLEGAEESISLTDLRDPETLEDEDEIQFDLSSDDLGLEETDNELFLEPDEIALGDGDSEDSALFEIEGDDEDISLHLEDISDENSTTEKRDLIDLTQEEGQLEIDLEALPLEESTPQTTLDEPDLSESEMITIVIDKEPGDSKD